MCTCAEFNYTGGKCQPGTYCPSGSSAPIDCDGGWYCEDFELETPSGMCDAGFYCPGGNIYRNPANFVCLSGHYCPVGSAAPTGCPNGTFTNMTGNTQLANCQSCTPGNITTKKKQILSKYYLFVI